MCNVTGRAYSGEPHGIREALVAQVVSPVLWADSMSRLIQDGHAVFVEVGPGKVLAGLMRDINRDVKLLGMQLPDDLSKLRAALN
jgi:[acyl-carrier-protein] S-malonyltransferase